MTDIKTRLIDGMRGQGIRLPDGDWLRLDDNNLSLIAERLLRTPGIAIVDLNDEDARLISGRWIDFARQNPGKAKGFATGLLWAAAQEPK